MGVAMNEHASLVWAGKDVMSTHGYSIVLTRRQQDVLLLLCEGLPNKLICRRLNISGATVKTHVASVLRSLNASNRLEAVILAFRFGLVQAVQAQRKSEPHALVTGEHGGQPATHSAAVAA